MSLQGGLSFFQDISFKHWLDGDSRSTSPKTCSTGTEVHHHHVLLGGNDLLIILAPMEYIISSGNERFSGSDSVIKT
nr:hypothetical protein CFP56_08957 [Quercus suber]